MQIETRIVGHFKRHVAERAYPIRSRIRRRAGRIQLARRSGGPPFRQS